MRVLFWSELFWPYLGGVEILAANVVSDMQKRGCEMLVLTSHAHLELPGLTEAVEARNWELAREQARLLQAAVEKNTALLKQEFARLERHH